MLTKEGLLKTILGKYETIAELLRNFTYDEIVEVISEVVEMEKLQFENVCVKGVARNRMQATCRYVIKDLIRNVDKYDWFYQHLEDKISKEIFTNVIRYRLIPYDEFLQNAHELSGKEIVNDPVVMIDKEEKEFVVSKIIKIKDRIMDSDIPYGIVIDDLISDFWVVPMLIYTIREDYGYHLNYVEEENQGKIILYIVPKKKTSKSTKK